MAEIGNGISDEELVRHARTDLPRAFESLVERFRGSLLEHLRRKTPRPQDAEDLVQETFLRAYQNLHRYDVSRPLGPWLLTIASNLAVSHARARRGAADIAGFEPAAKDADPRQQAAAGEAADALWKLALRELPAKQYEAIWLRYAREMSVAQIAGHMRITRIYVKVLLHRARRRLMASRAMLRLSAARPAQSGGNGRSTTPREV